MNLHLFLSFVQLQEIGISIFHKTLIILSISACCNIILSILSWLHHIKMKIFYFFITLYYIHTNKNVISQQIRILEIC